MNELTAGWYGIWDAMLGNHIFMERAILKASGKKGLSIQGKKCRSGWAYGQEKGTFPEQMS